MSNSSHDGEAIIDLFFNPRKIALIGASTDYRKLGNSILMNLLTSEVKVYPITRNRNQILGVKTYSNLGELPESVDLVIVAVAAKYCPNLMKQIRDAGARNAVIISGGFSEIGQHGIELENELVNQAQANGVRIIGPNCVGISNSRVFNGTFTMMPERGNIAFVSQSGALGGITIYNTRVKRIGISKFASIGNAADVSFPELLDYFASDEKSSVIAVYIEGIDQGRDFFESLKRAAAVKPVVVLKGGRSRIGEQATKFHTGSLAGSIEVFNGMIKQTGCVTAPSLDTLLEICKLFDYQQLPKSRNIGIISNTGGAGVLAADAAADVGLNITNLNENTTNELRQLLPPIAATNNPIDVVASAGHREYKVTTELLLKDDNVDMLLVICGVPTFAGMTQTEHAAGTLEGIRTSGVHKPVIGVWLAGEVGKPGKDLLEMNRVPCYDDPYLASLCMSKVAAYSEFLQSRVSSDM